MKVQSISVYNVRRTLVNQPKLKDAQPQETTQNQPSFKGDKGAVIGVFGGALLGVLTTAAIVATGGLAGVVAAVGYGGALTAGAAAGTHAGGIAGGLIEDAINKK